MRTVVYVLHYSAETERHAQLEYRGRPWARPLSLPANPYLESGMYMGLIEQLEEEWADADLVGTISWKASRKIEVPHDLDGWLAGHGVGPETHDVVALYPLERELIAQATLAHPRFLEIWEPLLVGLGYDREAVLSPAMPAFFGNYWLARPEWLRGFCAFMHRVRRELETRADLQEALFDCADPGRYPPETCRRLWNRDYIPYHAFVCERLACFYFWHEGARIWLGSPILATAPAREDTLPVAG